MTVAPGGGNDAAIAAMIHDLLTRRAADATLCPSEVARALWPDSGWRESMPAVRAVAIALAGRDVLELRRSGAALPPEDLGRGPIRIARGPRFDA